MFDLLNRTLKIQHRFLFIILLCLVSSASYAAHVNVFNGTPGDINAEPHDVSGGPHDAHWSWANPTPPSAMTNISYYIDSGSFSIDQALRIQDAASIWSNAGALVTLTQSNNAPSADIFISSSMTSTCGSFVTNNTLGCARFDYGTSHNPSGYSDGHDQHLMLSNSDPMATQTMTFLTDPNLAWNAQSTGGTTGLNQYDFMTVAIHEFGHNLGLGHNIAHLDAANSPLQSNINTGQEFRSLALSDVGAVQHLYGVVPLPAGLYLFLSGLFGLIVFAKNRAS